MGSTSATHMSSSSDPKVFHQAMEQITKAHNPKIEIATSHRGARFLECRQDRLDLDSMRDRISRARMTLVVVTPMRQMTLPADIAVKTSGRGRVLPLVLLLLFGFMFQTFLNQTRSFFECLSGFTIFPIQITKLALKRPLLGKDFFLTDLFASPRGELLRDSTVLSSLTTCSVGCGLLEVFEQENIGGGISISFRIVSPTRRQKV